MDHLTIFDELYPKFKITKPVRLIEFFAGYGSQALALKYLGVKFEHWKICEWAVKSIQAYKDIHFTDVNDDWNKGFKIEDLQEHLFNLGISSNYNEPMTLKQIQRLPEKQLRQIHNNICNTNNLVNIQQVKGKDLEIEDKEDYCYILTYSFPCQDLSLAGKGKGMSDTSTRSGMLWEVERILKELKETDSLPQVLLMENVPQVHSVDNTPDFNKWQIELTKLGYKNYWEDLIATDYGIPQTRNRCFMVSILGDYNYSFPKPIPLEKKLKDLLEDNVDEKYFLSNAMISYICSRMPTGNNKITTGINMGNRKSIDKAGTLTTGEGSKPSSNYIIENDNYDYSKDEGKINVVGKTKSGGENNGVVVKPKVIGGIGEKDSNNNTQWKQQNRIYDNNVSIAVTTCFNPNYLDNNLRIRKLTPKECGRLMNVKDEDIDKLNLSDSAMYHIFGDSICSNVLMALFGEMLDIDWEKKVKEMLDMLGDDINE